MRSTERPTQLKGGRDRFAPLALAPLFVTGAWLGLVPDRVAFTASQWATVAHVAVGVLALPLLARWGVRHVRQFRRVVAGGARAGLRWGLVATTLLVAATGVVALWAGQGTRLGDLHLWSALLPALALALHLAAEGRRVTALLVTASLAVAVAVPMVARKSIRGEPVMPRTPVPDGRLRPLAAFDEAAWCGECHTRNYEEWSRSVHARSLTLPVVRQQFEEAVHRLGQGGPDGADSDLTHVNGQEPSGVCVRCHLPVTYFGNDPRSVLTAPTPTRDGVTCSFCHTLRPPGRRLGPSTSGGYEMERFQPAPETVRRYLGQNADNLLARTVGNLLLRWRPEMHRRDYHSPLLDRSDACVLCHGALPDTTFTSWSTSPFAPSVTCQDCHMVTRVTGRPVREPGAHVPWGDVRPQHRSHLFLGGNVRAMLEGQDEAGARAEHELARRSLRIQVDGVERSGTRLVARVTVANEGIGHLFPGMETVQRYAWVQVRVLDARGTALADSGAPDGRSLETHPAVFFRAEHDRRVIRDTTIPPRGQRTVSLTLDVPSGEPARVEAMLFNSFDEEPIVRAERPL